VGTGDTGGVGSLVDTASPSAFSILVVEAGGVGTDEVGGVASLIDTASKSFGGPSVISIHTHSTD